MQNELCRLTRRPSRDCYVTALVGLVGLLLSASAGLAQQTSPPPAQGSAVVPTFESLPHTPLPPGGFVTWCGQNDRYLLRTQKGILAYEGGKSVSPPLSIPLVEIQCGVDGRELAFVKSTRSPKEEIAKGVATKIDIVTGKSTQLATFSYVGLRANISFSPDLQSVATDTPLQLTTEAANLRIVPLKRGADGEAGKIFWSLDGSRIAVINYSERKIEVLDRNGNRLAGGPSPEVSGFIERGWFDVDQQAVVLLSFDPEDVYNPGSVFMCRITTWECRELKSRIHSASVGGRGLMGTVGPLDKPITVEGGATDYARYLAELRDGGSKLLVWQVLVRPPGRSVPAIQIAPSGRQAVLTWIVTVSSPACPKVPSSFNCHQGRIVDLTNIYR